MGTSIKKAVEQTTDIAKQALIKTSDGLSAAVQLSQDQLQKVEAARKEYLTTAAAHEQDKLDIVAKCLSAIHTEITQEYLPFIGSLYRPVAWENPYFSPENRIRFFDITKWTVDSKENSLDKLVNIYQVLSKDLCSIALIYTRKISGCTVTMAVENNGETDQPAIANGLNRRFQSAFLGNFPGAELGETHSGIPLELRENLSGCAVAAVSNLASEKSEDFISQSMEKLLDGIVPTVKEDEYSIVLLASPASNLRERQNRLCRLYTELSPYATWQKNRNSSTSLSETAAGSASVSGGILIVGGQFGLSATAARSIDQSQGETETYTDYAVKHTQDILEKQIERMEQCSALGMWDFAAYVVSANYNIAENVAHMYLSLTQGEKSYMEQAAINIWTAKKAAPLLPWLRALRHPKFALHPEFIESNQENLIYPAETTVTTALSGQELARALNFPRKSVSGLPVYECVPFGREVVEYAHKAGKPTVPLGKIYHMRQEGTASVQLDRDSLTAHTFITGSTGAGKSNTIYTLLDHLCFASESDTRFLVIEPAKGEYKEALGGYSNVQVYGTNPYKTPLLRLNPFSFPEDTHVLEHIDRLVEVFNACWPMYAAMPAVLKAAVEQAYKVCGWSLSTSRCAGTIRFPTFRDVMCALPDIVDSKGFSSDTQGDYRGALLTRLESLTNGINGQVLCACDELRDEELFDRNVIVDLSRVGSSETKALLMGILILKLQEYRMAQRAAGMNRPNSGLRHITVLEEAHNLLRRTSTEQNQESSNLQGKSVEMLTNAIAEMRTYGEGFIIADQSPGLLDMAVIRNTNTKLILRLPDEGDRILVGKAAGLNDDQIVELSRLDTGVAAVYQNHWLEPVLCKVAHFTAEKPYHYQAGTLSTIQDTIHNLFMKLFAFSDSKELSQEDVDILSRWIESLNQGPETKKLIYKALKNEPLSEKEQQIVAYDLFEGKQMVRFSEDSQEEVEGIRRIDSMLLQMDGIQDEALAVRLRQLILRCVMEQAGMERFKRRFAAYAMEGGLL